MEKILVTIIALAFILPAKAQVPDTAKNPAADTTLYSVATQMPEFPGGDTLFFRNLAMSIRYPRDAREKHKQGKVIVQMIIEKDGSISHVRALRPVFPSLDAEAVRVVKASPNWKPARENGYPVRIVYVLPISFKLDDDHVYIMKN